MMMKTRTFFMLSAMVILFASLVTSCKSDEEKKNEGQQDVSISEQDNMDNEYLRDIDAYRIEADAEFAANDSILADFRERLKTEKNEADRTAWENETNDLERRNNEMRAKLRDYQPEDKTKWESFKEEFKHDMAELGEAFKNLGVNNK